LSGSLPASADIVVIGGGIVGASIAKVMAESGRRTVLVERGAFGGAVSGASLACIGTHMISELELPWLIEAARLWSEFAANAPLDIEYRRCGQIRFVERESDIAVARRWIEIERAQGLAPQLLDPKSAREIEPALAGPIVAATWSPDDAVVNPFRAVRAMIAAGIATGRLSASPATPASRIVISNGRVVGIETPRGTIATSDAVLAAGPWTRRLAATAGIDAAIEPRKAQCLATLRMAPSIRTVVGACETAGGVEAGYTQIQQAASGQILFNTVLGGGLSADGAQDGIHEVDAAFVRNSIATLMRLFPSLASAQLLRSWARFEAVTSDERFLAGRTEVGGLLLAAGDNGTGFCRAPMIAKHLSALLDAGGDPDLTELFDPSRRLAVPA
jgi:D-hydroxyproline dehydrogenase subunit beta